MPQLKLAIENVLSEANTPRGRAVQSTNQVEKQLCERVLKSLSEST